MRSGNRGRKPYSAVWDDLQPWVEQLYHDHKVYLDIRVHLFAQDHKMQPTVEVCAYRVGIGHKREEIRRETAVLTTRDIGHAEHLALQMGSRILLDLENELAAAERATAFWPA